jgi:hypothetical protein
MTTMMTTGPTPLTLDPCPICGRLAPLSDARESGVTFLEPVCGRCRATVLVSASMNSFDVAYARAAANGWAD